MTGSARAVYTAMIGAYETPLDQPIAKDSSIDFICFTDDPNLRSDEWEVRLVDRTMTRDAVRSARALKTIGHPSLAQYEETLWIDNRVRLLTDPATVLDAWLAEGDLAVPRHSYRADVVTEFQAVLEAGLDEASRVYEQLHHYSESAPQLLRHAVPWTGIMARRHTPEVNAAMEQWFHHILRYSRRDQLSFVQSMHEAGVRWTSIDLPNAESDLHEWRHPAGRSTRPLPFQIAETLQPPVAELGQLRMQHERTVEDLFKAIQTREDLICKCRNGLTQSPNWNNRSPNFSGLMSVTRPPSSSCGAD